MGSTCNYKCPHKEKTEADSTTQERRLCGNLSREISEVAKALNMEEVVMKQ